MRKAHWAGCGPLFDYLVGAGKQRLGKRHAKLLGAFQVEHQLEFGRLLDRQIGRLAALQHAIHVISQAAIGSRRLGP